MAESSHSHAAVPEEPTTPLWVTLLGATLLALAALYFLLPSGEPEAGGAPGAEAPTAPKN